MSIEKAPATFGLTGGMGSGKSTVAAGLAERGAVVLDADAIVRDLLQPGELAFAAMVSILGQGILKKSGELDREAAAEQIFSDEAKKQAVDSMVHPLVWEEMRAGISRSRTDDIVVLDVPLLFETKPADLDLLSIVVDTPAKLAISRLVEHRGFSEEEAKLRIAQQMPQVERIARADYLISNAGSKEDLEKVIDNAWQWMESFRMLL